MSSSSDVAVDPAPWHSIEPYASLYKPNRGDWYRTRRPPSKIRCFGYSAPLDMVSGQGGIRLGCLERGEYFGPAEEYLLTRNYLAVLVKGWWINVWSFGGRSPEGVHFAFKVPDQEVARWKNNGWRD